jgi:hypothetical protein
LLAESLALVLALAPLPTGATEPDQDEQEPPRALDVDDDTVFPEFPDAPPDAPEARLRIYFDLASREQMLAPDVHEPFVFHVVAHDVQIALRGWEARVVVDPRIKVLERDVEGLNVGRGDEFLVGLKPKNCKSGETMILATYRCMLAEEGLQDLVIGLAPTQRSSFDPPRAGYLVCRPGADLRTFDHCDTCAVVNPVQVRPSAEDQGPLQDLLEPLRGRR